MPCALIGTVFCRVFAMAMGSGELRRCTAPALKSETQGARSGPGALSGRFRGARLRAVRAVSGASSTGSRAADTAGGAAQLLQLRHGVQSAEERRAVRARWAEASLGHVPPALYAARARQPAQTATPIEDERKL